ncbi:MAG: hypothetical protein R2813_05995 [Flavobacteriales bacterium]
MQPLMVLINNMEQVEIFSPASGSYSIKIKVIGPVRPSGNTFFSVLVRAGELVLTYPGWGRTFDSVHTGDTLIRLIKLAI